MIIDTHAHLNDERLVPMQEEIINGMTADNLEAIVNVGCDYLSSKDSVELSNKHSKIYATVGAHPHDAKTADNNLYDYMALSSKLDKVVAFGEIGLDYYYDYSPREIQQKALREQIDLAYQYNMPIVIHLRDAYQDMYDILKDMKTKLINGVQLHCYSGSVEMLERFNEFDCFYSFGGAITFAKNKDKVIKAVPEKRLLLETDCPYMTPVPFRGKTNLPKYIALVRDKIAEMLGKNSKEIEEITTYNAKELFPRLR